MLKIKEVQAKSIITKSNLPDADYVINPYTGCMHSCIYCYARFMKRFTGHSEPWGQFVDIKINATDLIPASSSKYKDKFIFISSVTDAYQPIEKKYKLTRQILQKLIPLQPNLGTQTKSDLITRDIDLLKQFKNCEVGITITTLDDNLRKEVEPLTSSIENRIKALEELKRADIKTYIFIGPIFPLLTNWKEIILATRHCVDFYMFENLNTRGSVWNNIKKWLDEKYPDLLEDYINIYSSKNNYWEKMETDIKKFCQEQKIPHKIYFDHSNKKK